MEKFNLSEWLKDKSRKVVTRDGREVEILKTNRKDGVHPIIFTILDQNGIEQVHFCNKDGICTTLPRPNKFDLFFADKDWLNTIIHELKCYLKNAPKEQVEKDWKEIQDWYNKHFANKSKEEEGLTEFEKEMQEHYFPELDDFELKRFAKCILDLARKELEKDNVIINKDRYLKICDQYYNNGKKELLKDFPMWKKELYTQNRIDAEGTVHYNGWSISLKELFKILSKE